MTAEQKERLAVGGTILEQLGGNAFAAMTGAHSFAADTNCLIFKLPGRFAKNGIKGVKISLEPTDLYKMEFWAIHGLNVRKVAEQDGVYFDQLQAVFTDVTGLDCHL